MRESAASMQEWMPSPRTWSEAAKGFHRISSEKRLIRIHVLDLSFKRSSAFSEFAGLAT
jgi:hypothetical protein